MARKVTYEELDDKVKALEKEVMEVRQTYRAMREQHHLFETVFTLMPSPLVVKSRDFVYLAANSAFCELLAKREKDIIGKTDFEIFPPAEAEAHRRDDSEVVETGKPKVGIEETNGAEGKAWWQVARTPFFDTAGTCAGLLCSVHDITDWKKTHEALIQREADFWKVNKELLDTNRALSVLAANIEKNWQEVERRIGLTISAKVMPIIKELQKDEALRHRPELDMLATYMRDLTSGLTNGKVIATSLSSTELRIAAMIKNGLTSEEIANQLHVSLHTVKTHRKNIRKKLNIRNSSVNLPNFLRSKMA